MPANPARGSLLRPGAGHEVGVVGLGVGTLAAYGRRGDHYRFYEINPLVIELARSRFSFLADSAAAVDVVLGDARLSLEKEPDSNFDTLVLDAFSGDSIPVHLLTREAFATYFRHLIPGGVMAVHISNRYLDLAPIITGCAAAFGRPAVRVLSEPRAGEAISAADWILVSTDRIFLSGVEHNRLGHALLPGKGRFWTDHYSNILGLFR